MIEWLTIPAGEFVMGSSQANVLDEAPSHSVFVPAFQISRTPITNSQYLEFVRATGRDAPGHWVSDAGHDGTTKAMATSHVITEELLDHPVTYVDWYDARAFAEWLGARLPTEAEWEKAARGVDGRVFPWGDADADETRAHFAQDVKRGGTCSVLAHSDGASPYGALDLAGNVWEWVSSESRAYPYRADDGRENKQAQGERVLRGGSFYSGSARFLTCATRSASFPTRRRDHIGFRVARTI